MPTTRASATATALLLGALLALPACSDDESGTTVLGPDAEVVDVDRAALLLQYFENFASVPPADNWITDPSKCDMGRSTADVYFAPSWTSPDQVASCTMQADQVLFLTPVGAFCLEDETTAADNACLDTDFEGVVSSVTIDGEPVDDMAQYTTQYEPRSIDLIEDNLFGMAAGPTNHIGRAQVVLVEGLAEGDHEIVLAGEFNDGFAGSLTLTLTVE